MSESSAAVEEWPRTRYWTVERYQHDSPQGATWIALDGVAGKLNRVDEHTFTLTTDDNMVLRDMIDAHVVTLDHLHIIVVGWVNQHDGVVRGKLVDRDHRLDPEYHREKWCVRLA